MDLADCSGDTPALAGLSFIEAVPAVAAVARPETSRAPKTPQESVDNPWIFAKRINAAVHAVQRVELHDSMNEVDGVLQQAAQSYATHRAELERRRGALQARERRLAAEMAKLDSALQVTDTRQQVARERMDRDMSTRIVLSVEEKTLRAELATWQTKLAEMASMIALFSDNERFLGRVVDGTSDFASIGDVLEKYDSIEYAFGEAQRSFAAVQDQVTALKAVLRQKHDAHTNIANIKSAATKVLKERIVQARAQHEDLRNRDVVMMWRTKDALTVEGRTSMTIDNMVAQIRRASPEILRMDDAGRLDQVSIYISFLEAVRQKAASM